MSKVSAEIVSLNDELGEIRKRKAEKQEMLAKRMKRVYEKGGSKGMLQSILEANSFRNILTRYEYANAIIKYDRQKIVECKELEKELENKVADVEAKEAELNAYQDELDNKYSELEHLTDEVKGKLDKTNSSISAETGKLKDFDSKLAALDKTMKSLESQTAAAQAQLAKQVAQRLSLKKEDTSGSYSASGSELEWLAATIQAEAGGESYTGKLAVGSVIMNRVKSSAFPNDIKSVITQNMQFASYRSGKVELIIANGPNSTCVSAANEVLGGARVGDYLFFMTKYYADYYGISEYTMIGNHAFFYRWATKGKQPDPEEPSPEEEQPEEKDEPAEDQPAEEEPSDDDDDDDDDPEEEPSEEEDEPEDKSCGELIYFIKSDYNPKETVRNAELALKSNKKKSQSETDTYKEVIKNKDKMMHVFDSIEKAPFYAFSVGKFDKGAIKSDGSVSVGNEWIWTKGLPNDYDTLEKVRLAENI